MSNRRCPKCGEEFSDTYRSCPFCEEEEAIKRGRPPRRSGRRVEKRQNARNGGAGGVMLLLTGLIILGVVGYVVLGEDVADALGIRDTQEPASVIDQDKVPSQPDSSVQTAPVQSPAENDPAPAPDAAGNEPEHTDQPDLSTEPAGPLTLSQTDITIPAGETGRLTATGGSGEIIWSSSNPEIASVDGGSVTGKAGGTVTITAASGEETAACQVKVEGDPWIDPNIPELSLNKTDFTFGQSDIPVQMKLLIKGTRDAYEGAVVWASNNTSVAAISETGSVTWVGRGTTTVTATVGDKTFECIVRAK
ncbi:MAG: Ig-like domain-containing protein [Oscillospiraceae bacterium]|nr:Ig-like domain-containing protein [Oscillospiraceae bacterium]